MSAQRPDAHGLISSPDAPQSLKRILQASTPVDRRWIGAKDGASLTKDDLEAYDLAHKILCHICAQAPTKHNSGHPGGPLSAFTLTYGLLRRRNPHQDSPLRMSVGHLSLLAYGMQYLGGRADEDERLRSPQAIIDSFRTVKGLPGHVQAGIGDIPFGTGLLGKGVSNGLGYALGKRLLKRPGVTDVLMGDGDSQEGQIMEAARLAAGLKLDTLIVHADINDLQITGPTSAFVAADLAAIFQAMGWAVVEVERGNDPACVEAALDAADALVGQGRPIIVCYYTTMGQGIEVMEKAANEGKSNYHGAPLKEAAMTEALTKLPPLEDLVKAYEPHRQKLKASYKGAQPAAVPLPPIVRGPRTITADKGSMRKDFGATHVLNLMKTDPRIYVVHGDLAESGGFVEVAKEFPGRVINAGVSEANMVMMAAGMRQAGLLPIAYTFAAFGTNEARANVRLVDINAGHVPCAVLYDCTHTGLSVGEDGETAQERNYFTLPFDHLQVWMPADSNQAGAMAERGLDLVASGKESVFVFAPRAGQPALKSPDGSVLYGAEYVFDGKINLVRGAGDFTDQVTILATGNSVHDAVAVAEELAQRETPIRVRVLNVACIRPIDAATIIEAALETQHLIVVEDHSSEGGIASQVADIIADFQLPCSLRRLGVNHYFPSAPAEDLLFLAGLDQESIANAVEDELRTEVSGGEDLVATMLFTLPHHASQSRFHETVLPFIERLREEKGYLEALREHWKARSVEEGKLPTNDRIRQILGSVGKMHDAM